MKFKAWNVRLPELNVTAAIAKFTVALFLCLSVTASNAGPSLHLSVQDINGDTFSLSEYSGSVVYVDFWASWCGPCRKSFPWMNAMHQKYATQGLKIIAINLDTETKLAQQFLTQIQADFAIAYDPDMQVATEFEILGMPSSYLFNRKGELVAKHVGFYREEQPKYEAEIQRWLEVVDD